MSESELSEGSNTLSPNELADAFGSASGGAEEAADDVAEHGGGIVEMLRSSEPPVTPAAIGEELDVAAEWHEHMACGFIKASGSSGTEAWMHFIMAVGLAVSDVAGEGVGGTSDQDVEEAQEQADGDEDTFAGPQ